MPLTLECVCGGIASKSCQLVEATFRVSVSAVSRGATQGLATCELVRNGVDAALVSAWIGPATYNVPLNILNLVEDWAGMYIRFGCESSLYQPVDAGSTYSAAWRISLKYICVDTVSGDVTERVVDAVNLGTGECKDERTYVRAMAVVGQGGGTASQFNSSPISGGGCFVDVGGFYPTPETAIVDLYASDGICLCPSGGEPPYQFFIVSGRLPCGQTLNRNTGCIEGSPDGTCEGTGEITFQVFDSLGDHAEVTCGFPKPVCAASITPEPADLLLEGQMVGLGLATGPAEIIFDGQETELSVNSCGGGFTLTRIVVSLRPATHAPVRGSA